MRCCQSSCRQRPGTQCLSAPATAHRRRVCACAVRKTLGTELCQRRTTQRRQTTSQSWACEWQLVQHTQQSTLNLCLAAASADTQRLLDSTGRTRPSASMPRSWSRSTGRYSSGCTPTRPRQEARCASQGATGAAPVQPSAELSPQHTCSATRRSRTRLQSSRRWSTRLTQCSSRPLSALCTWCGSRPALAVCWPAARWGVCAALRLACPDEASVGATARAARSPRRPGRRAHRGGHGPAAEGSWRCESRWRQPRTRASWQACASRTSMRNRSASRCSAALRVHMASYPPEVLIQKQPHTDVEAAVVNAAGAC